MAYNESTVGGSQGSKYRVWVNSIRTYDGGPGDNSEDWRVEGGLNKIATGTSAYRNDTAASYNLQLGLNGVASSGGFSYNFGTNATGRMVAWGTGATKVYRNSAGEGFGFQSRMDINLQNSPYLTSGWVTSNDAVQTKYRHANLTGLSTDGGNIPATDEGPIWVEFNNPGGAAVDAFLEAPDGNNRVFTSPSGIGSRYNYPFEQALMERLQQATPNSNTFTLRIGIHDNQGGDSYDYRDRTYTIKNDQGQANPTYGNFTYKDANAATVAVTGTDQVIIQNKSSLEVKVPVADKATPKKFATMSSYAYAIGGYSQNAPWSNTADVVKTVGPVTDVTGNQSLAVAAVDSRGNSTTVTKTITVLPYQSPVIIPSLAVTYTNSYDADGGITVSVPSSVIANISPLTYAGSDKNAVVAASGVKFDLSKGSPNAYSGTPVNVPTTRVAGSNQVTTNLTNLGFNILTKMNQMGADNTEVWYVKFTITDKLETTTFQTTIDIGRSVFRIGYDGRVYNQEQALMPTHVGQVIFSTTLDTAAKVAEIYAGEWELISEGRNPVGYDANDTDFNAPRKTGGQKDVQAHTHYIGKGNDNNLGGGYGWQSIDDSYGSHPIGSAGSGTTNMNPYFVMYIWERIS